MPIADALVAMATDCPQLWCYQQQGSYLLDMTLIQSTLAAVPELVILTITAGRIVAAVAREATTIIVTRLALRDTRPDERADIIRALLGSSQPVMQQITPRCRRSAAQIAADYLRGRAES